MLRFFPTLLILIFATSLFAQSNIRKANKQYELYAFNLAIKSYLKVLERHPDNPEALGKLADCYRHLNRMKDAEQWYSKAVQQSGADDLFFMQYGEVLKSLGKYEEAKKWFLRYAQKYPVAGTQFAESCAFAIAHRGDVPNYNVQSEYLNTSSSDFSPTTFTSGRVVYASSRKDIRNKRGNSNDIPNNQLFVTSRDANNYLEAPQLLKNTFGNATNEAPVAYSPDGKTVAITKNNFVEGTRQIPSSGLELSLYFAEVDGNGDWKNVVAYPYNGSGYSTAFGGFSADGNAVYFASDRPDGFGGFDIYISYRVGNSWSAPENLGAAVNTQGNEITPFHDGTYLYFSSDWHKGFGSFDVFIAGQTNGRWNQISNAGTGINTGRDDFGFVYDNYNNVGYLVSNRLGGKGYEDIYRISRTGDVILKNNKPSGITSESNTNSGGNSGGGNITIEPTIDNTPLPTGQTALHVMDAKSGTPLSNVKVTFDNCPVPGGFTQANGRFLLKVASKSNCIATLTKIGYATRNIELDAYVAGQTGDIDIYLKQGSASSGSYSGRIADNMSDYFLEDVLVQVTNTASGEILSTRTDNNGNYLLPLKSNTAYKFRFSKVGFKDLTLSLTTGGETASKVLETIKITPSNAIGGLSGDQSVGGITADSPQNGGGIRIEEPTTALVYEDRYAVQIAALSPDKPSNLDGFRNKVGRLGEVYNHIQDGRNKIRVGLYTTRDEAASAQKELRAKGFEGAFIVTQTKKVERTINQSPSQSRNTIGSVTPPKEREIAPAGVIGEPTNYMVQIAAFKNTGNFDKTKVMDIGVVQEFPKGNLTAIILSGYDSKEQAQRAVKKAKSRGFTGAYLVQNVAGNLVKAK